MIEYINFAIFIIALIAMAWLYTISIQPKKLEKEIGEKAWKKCEKLRSYSGLCEMISTINMILWVWYPIEQLNWPIFTERLTAIITGIFLMVPLTIIMVIGWKDAGKETLHPSTETKLYGGIYNYIRHPQTLGEFPMFAIIAMMINSWFLFIVTVVYLISYIPIMIHYEEKDLILRFGKEYEEYRKRTGALFPKIFKKKKKCKEK